MITRAKKALTIQGGASNPIPCVAALFDGLAELRAGGQADTKAILDDPSLRLIVHHLAFLFNTHELDDSPSVYVDTIKLAEEQAS
jgi:hypothetical protein